ncbi:hypothetical protein HGO34_25850 [Agrobacterium vitis]|uniref:Lipoprotein n=1 Tax=Agrobacterium vitis TaxID=373 RepID=A0AAE4WIT4_AGRVI|nr:hypothetical protein [Agrobacterium vitis]MCF1497086.1 hypothetical protein [Allorhizobium sp. Av2]MCM2443129.1 hypothetical protein [Agrobacterium vitis]MUZ60738.1 hypothetical protein [Agrobacterium vitis]MVA68929.1 hypothetical protein [Agrobacterium vitis]MVA90045.1 hypothetical protein [Agrobacterium vitis]
MRVQYVALVALAAISSCAKRPDAIVPVDIPMAAYTNMDCQAIAQEMVKEQGHLAAISKQQNDAANGDALGVFLLGVPVSSTFGGDKEGQVAVTKGKINAMESAMRSKGCNAPPAEKIPTRPVAGSKPTPKAP